MNKLLLITVMLSSIIFIISCSPTNKKASIATVKTVTPESATTHSSSTIQPLANEVVANEERLISVATPVILDAAPDQKGTPSSETQTKTVTHESATTHSSSSIQPLANEAVASDERLISIVTPSTLIDAAPDQNGTLSSDTQTKTVTHESATTHSSSSIQPLTEDQAMEIKFLRTAIDTHASQLSNIDKDLVNISEQMLTRPQDIKVLTLRQYAQLNQKSNYEKDITWLQKKLDDIYMKTGVIQK